MATVAIMKTGFTLMKICPLYVTFLLHWAFFKFFFLNNVLVLFSLPVSVLLG